MLSCMESLMKSFLCSNSRRSLILYSHLMFVAYKKAIYRLQQASCAWFSTFSQFLLQYGSIQSTADHSLFIHITDNNYTILLLYVDDIILTRNSDAFLSKFTADLHSSFKIKNLGSLHFFLSVQVTITQTGMLLSQEKYIDEVITRAGMSNCKAVATPMVVKYLADNPSDASPFHDPSFFRSIVVSLQYITITRPEISFVVNKCMSSEASSN